MGRLRNNSRGFTIIELMTAVIILAILSTVAVVSYKKYLRRGKNMEAIYFLSDIGIKQTTYFSIHGQFVDTSSSPSTFDEGDFFPTPITNGDKPWGLTCPADKMTYPGWCGLGARPSTANVNYQYVTVGWEPGVTTAPPARYIKDPNRHWWFAVARGDLDGNGVYSTFILSSEVTEVYYFNEVE